MTNQGRVDESNDAHLAVGVMAAGSRWVELRILELMYNR